MCYGRIDNDGLRCPYHGWKYDVTGKCLDQPAEPPESTYKDSIQHPAYPVQEAGGVLFGYLGPAPAPLLPRYDVLAREDWVRRVEVHPVLDCNWLKPMENAVDPAHLYWLHGYTGGAPATTRDEGNEYDEFEYGIYKSHIGETRTEVHPLVFPNILRGPGHVAHFRIPVDDTHSKVIYILYNPTPDGSPAGQQDVPYQYIGPIKEAYDDQGMTRYRHHMASFASQDGMAWETQGAVADREREHLASSDRGIIMLRKLLEQQIRVVEDGGDPLGVLREPHDVINFKVQQTDRRTGKTIPWPNQERRSFALSVAADHGPYRGGL